MNIWPRIFVVTVCLLVSAAAVAQPNLSTASVKIGSIRNLFSEDVSSGQFSFYPELQIGGKLTSEQIEWALYWGFWNDGLSETNGQNGTTNFSQTSHILGGRIYFRTPNVFGNGYPVDIGFMTGYSHHFVQSQVVDAEDNEELPAADGVKSELNNIEFGLMIGFSLFGPVKLIGEIHQFIPINAEGVNLPANRRAYKTGLAISF